MSGDRNENGGTRAKAQARVQSFIDSQVVYAAYVKDESIPKVKTVLSHMVRACEDLEVLIYHGDIDTMYVGLNIFSGDSAAAQGVSVRNSIRQYGWERYLQVSFGVRENPVTAAAKEFGLGGDTLTYFLGGGQTPGMIAGRRAGILLCGGESSKEKQQDLISIPDFEVIDSL
ncbi:MAG: hypothetical protein ACOCW2_00840 [Chitinivibrionales bacterium]